jgi:hypothetical protein
MYFSNFPKIIYPFSINNKVETRVVVDITKNIRVMSNLLSNVTLFDEYIISDGETIEFISEKFYGTPDYHWTIMLANNRYDYLNDFPLSQTAMDQVISDKYGIENINNIHHYEGIINGITYIVDKIHVGCSPITNSDYEYDQNEKKRLIKIISPNIINKVVQELGVI